MTLDREQKGFLLALARSSLEAAVSNGSLGEILGAKAPDWALVPSGAFVTLKEAGELRGCIGSMAARDSLYATIARMACAAALEDPRFEPVSERELPRIEIEISVLTPMVPIRSVEEIEVGRHGVHVSSGYRSAVFLPQVPVEWGWDRDTYLRQLLRKANLPETALADEGTCFCVFEAIVFGE